MKQREKQTPNYVTQRDAWRLGISRGRLDLAVKNGEVRVIHSGVNRFKVRRDDVLKILGIEEADTKAAA